MGSVSEGLHPVNIADDKATSTHCAFRLFNIILIVTAMAYRESTRLLGLWKYFGCKP